MILTAMDDFNDTVSSDEYLDISQLSEGLRYTKIAYVQNASVGLQKNNGGFVSFYLKDCNGCRITARLFNVEDFMISGIKASAFAHCPVKLTFVPQIFAGSMSLVIDSKLGIEKYTGELDYSKFIGVVEVPVDEIVSTANAAGLEDWVIPSEWKTKSIDTLCGGKAGGFAALVYSSMYTVSANAIIVNMEVKSVMKVFFYAMDIYFHFLCDKSKNPIVGELIVPDVLTKIKFTVTEKSEEYLPVYDTVKALCGFGKPLGLEAHLIKRAVELSTFMLNAKESLAVIPPGTKAYIGGVDLLRY